MKDEQMRLKCIAHIKEGLQKYQKVIVVVSAIGRKNDPYSTDSLLQLTEAFSSVGEASDLAASCGELIAAAVLSAELERAGVPNTILHGAQAGILTKGPFGDGTIVHIDPTTMMSRLEKMDCILVPGFQGIDATGRVMTLGRGGSDLTAIALAAAVNASHVEFFKDVPGVMTNDPHKFANARKLDVLSMDDFLPLLNCERPVIQQRAARHAIKTAIPLYIRGIASSEKGTWIFPS